MLSNGDRLDGKYEVIKVLGKGGMGTVYLCKNTRLENLWAIKEVNQDVKNINILSEANILKNLSHPGIRRIVDIFYENNNLYMVQDYVEGQTLKEYGKANCRIGTEKICQITSELCDIIGYLHNLNPTIIYRDIKPSNIMITPNEKVILIDFGISKIYKDDRELDTVCAGSNGYAAPEQYGLGKCCEQTDIYGIGMVIYFMVKGKSPSTALEPLIDENYDNDIDSDLKRIIQKCVQIDIKDRYISIEALKKEILEVYEKDEYEKTVILSKFDINASIPPKKIKIKGINKGEFKKVAIGILSFIVVVLASIYILNNNKKESIDTNTANKPTTSKPITGTPRVEKEPIVEPIAIPVKETTIESTQDSSIEEINTSGNEKKTPQAKEKAKGKEKKKSKPKHSEDYYQDND